MWLVTVSTLFTDLFTRCLGAVVNRVNSIKAQETHVYSTYSKLLLESGSEQLDDPDRPSLTSAFNPWRR